METPDKPVAVLFSLTYNDWLENGKCKHGETCWYSHQIFTCMHFFYSGKWLQIWGCLPNSHKLRTFYAVPSNKDEIIQAQAKEISELEKKILEKDEMIQKISSPLIVGTAKSNASAAPPCNYNKRNKHGETKGLTNKFHIHTLTVLKRESAQMTTMTKIP